MQTFVSFILVSFYIWSTTCVSSLIPIAYLVESTLSLNSMYIYIPSGFAWWFSSLRLRVPPGQYLIVGSTSIGEP